MRVEYGSVEKDGSTDLDVDWLADGWLALLHTWIEAAEQAGVAEPNAMVLATVSGPRCLSSAMKRACSRCCATMSRILSS